MLMKDRLSYVLTFDEVEGRLPLLLRSFVYPKIDALIAVGPLLSS